MTLPTLPDSDAPPLFSEFGIIETMRAHFSRFIQQAFGYGAGMVLNRFAGFVLVPIYTRLLSPADYGALDVVTTFSTMVTIFVFLGLDSAVIRFFFDTDDPAHQARVMGTGFWTVLAWTGLLTTLALLFAGPLARLVGNPAYERYLRIALLTIPFTVLHSFQLVMLRVRFDLARYNALAIGNLIAGAGLSVTLVAILRMGVMGILLGVLCGYVLTSAIGLWLNWRTIGPWSRPLLAPLLAMGLPLLPASLAYWVLGYSDRLFLSHLVAPAQIGLYAVANKLVSALALITTTFQTAWGPFSYSIAAREGALRTYAKALTYYTFITLGAGLALGIFAPEILAIFTRPLYVAAAPSVALLTYAIFANGCYYLAATGVNLAKKSAHIGWTTMVAAAVNTLLNILLIPRWGILGAATATGIGYLSSAVILYHVAQRVYPIPYEGRKLATIFCLQAALMTTGVLFDTGSVWANASLKSGLLLAYPLLLWLARCFDAWEVRLIAQALRQPRRLLGWVGGRPQ